MQSKLLLPLLCWVIAVAGLTVDDPDAGVHWALIVAGSHGYYNYRHQADVCHAYHVLHKHGLPDERIVVMMYDDIAQSPDNPTPGIIINHPNGSDVYQGVPKDYIGKDVTPANFLNILKGNADDMKGIGSGKVIKSKAEDHIFVYFADHGAPGLIAFPTEELQARPLMTALKSMFENKQFAQMVIYMEACESGSMFHSLLPKDINIYATTAANPHESSYACYYDTARKTYLGDVYSVKWLEDSDSEDLKKETLHKQFKLVKQETNTSHVMQYGDRNISKEVLSLFQGGKTVEPSPKLPYAPLNAVPSEDVSLSILHHKLSTASSIAEERAILEKIRALKQHQSDVQESMSQIVREASGSKEETDRLLTTRSYLTNFDCYEPVLATYKEYCYDFIQSDYALRQLYALVNLCEEGLATKVIGDAVKTVCSKF